jgi:hypothetical protein
VSSRLQLILLGIVASVATIDFVWIRAGHFEVDAPAYGEIALLAILFAVGGVFYEHVRKDERLAAMLIGTSFLLGMSAGFSVLNYLLITIAGHRIDLPLAALDRSLGVNWPAMMAVAAQHPLVNGFLQLTYVSVLPQIALLVAILGWHGKPERIYALCLALSAGVTISMAVWTLAPSFGAFSVYALPANVADHIALALDGHYARNLVALLSRGPGYISPTEAKGLIGFPSFHVVLAMLVVWHARGLAFVRWIALGLNSVVLLATPIQGGHHVVDVIAGLAVAAFAVLFANRIIRHAASVRSASAIDSQTAAV